MYRTRTWSVDLMSFTNSDPYFLEAWSSQWGSFFKAFLLSVSAYWNKIEQLYYNDEAEVLLLTQMHWHTLTIIFPSGFLMIYFGFPNKKSAEKNVLLLNM